MSTDFVPRPDAAFEIFFRNIIDYVIDNNPRWKYIPQGDVDALERVFAQWNNAYVKTLVPHIPQLTSEKNRVRITTEHALRAFINRYLRWPPVTDLDRDKMRIRNRKEDRSSQAVPVTIPEIEADTSVIRRLSLRMRDYGTAHWGKPAHVHGIELAWSIKDTCPEHIGDLPHLEIATANPIILTFEEEERGRHVFFAARWINNTAQPGPWSGIESAFIP